MRTWVNRILSWLHPGDRLLTASLDGEVSVWLAQAVRRHLKICLHCRSQAAEHELALRALHLAAAATDEYVLSQMLANGRARLLLSMDGTPPAELEPALRN